MKTKYRAIFISDVHLGTKNCKADQLIDFLKQSQADTLYLVGDIVDGWKIQQNRWRWKNKHTDVIREILKFSKKGSKVVYVAGNHDEFLRPLIPYRVSFGRVEIANQYEHVALDGKRFLITHGDLFDGITRITPWISFLGDRSYELVLSLNNKFNWIRHKLGFGYWSLSRYLKHKVKRAVNFMNQFEKNLAHYCKKRGFDGVICGHIHHAEIKEIDGVVYMNDGDWVESCTALIEHLDGRWEIIHWGDVKQDEKLKKDISDNRQSINSDQWSSDHIH